MKACDKCWSLGYKCQGLEGAKSSPWESQGPSPSQEQDRQGLPALLGQGLTAEMKCWDVSREGGAPGVQARTRGAVGALRDLQIVTVSSLCAPSDKGRCVCKHPVCSYKPDLRSMTEHLVVMIWWGNYLMLLFSPTSPPSLESSYFDCESNKTCLCLKEEIPWVYVCCLDSLHIKACDWRSSLTSWDRHYQQKQH